MERFLLGNLSLVVPENLKGVLKEVMIMSLESLDIP